MNSKEQHGLVILFPRPEDRRELVFFGRRGYEPTVVSSEAEPVTLEGESEPLPIRISVPNDARRYLDALDDATRSRLLEPALVLHHARTDVLAPPVEGSGSAWRLKGDPAIEAKTQTVNWILDGIRSPADTLWVNIHTGKHGTTKDSYCAGRYALGGFGHALRMSDRLKHLPVLNVCLTYFEGGSIAGCRHCLTRTYAAEIARRGGNTDALLQYIDELARKRTGPLIQ